MDFHALLFDKYSPSEVEFYQPSSSSLCCDNKLSKQDRFEISQSGSSRQTKQPVKILILTIPPHYQGNRNNSLADPERATHCWLRFCCCWTCWICWGAGLLRDGSITPGIPGRDTGLLPYPGGPMAGPCGVIRLDGGMPGLCKEKKARIIS